MKILAVCSGRENGNSSLMIQKAMEVVPNANLLIDVIHVGSMRLSFCDGCLSCDESGICHLNDDMSSIIAKIDSYHAFVFATPTRWSLLSGDMKVFFDRLNPLAASNRLEGKKAIIFVVGQSEKANVESISLAADSVRYFCENAGIEIVDSILATNCLNSGDILSCQNILDGCKSAMNNLVNTLRG
jgi:multimeric flavodoxin WrbA